MIKVVVGLGNPGKAYVDTRHNVGFKVIDRLVAHYGVLLQQRKFRADWGERVVEGSKIWFVKPMTYMNRSGQSVVEILQYFRVDAGHMLVVHDDLDMPCGRIRWMQRGGAGGHQGVASIIAHVGHQEFPRLKLGIGRPMHEETVEGYVLGDPYPDQRNMMTEMVAMAAEAVTVALTDGLVAAMNRYNRKPT